MANSTTKTIVAKLKLGHPTKSMRRAGYTFGEHATAYEVTPAQFQAIQADPMIEIITKGRHKEEALKATKAEANPEALAAFEQRQGEVGELDNTKASGDVSTVQKTETEEEEDEETEETDEDDKKEEEEEAEVLPALSTLNKEKIIALLNKKGLVEGQDYNPEATNKDLYALLTV